MSLNISSYYRGGTIKSIYLVLLFVLFTSGLAAAQDTAYFWVGNIDSTPVTNGIGRDYSIPVYFSGSSDVWISELYLTFGVQYAYINRFNYSLCSSAYWPFNAGTNGWAIRGFGDYNTDNNPPGWRSISFTGQARSIVHPDAPYLHSEVPIHILDFGYSPALDTSFMGQTIEAIGPGHGPQEDDVNSCFDTLGGVIPMAVQYSQVYFAPLQENAIYGHVSDARTGRAIDSVHVVVNAENTYETWSNRYGEYLIDSISGASCDVHYSQRHYNDTTIADLPLGSGPDYQYYNFDVTMITHDTAYFWAGGYFDEASDWHDTIYVAPDQWFDVPIYFYGGPGVWIPELWFPLGTRYALIDSFDIEGCSYDFWPFNAGPFPSGWPYHEFGNYSNDTLDAGEHYANPPGIHSLTYAAMIGGYEGPSWLHADSVMQILSFRLHTKDTDTLSGQIFDDAMQMGYDPLIGPARVGDTLYSYGYPVHVSYPVVVYLPRYAYLLGDVNMYNATWPPAVIGSDVTYLVNYFRGLSTSHPCLLDSFWGSADVNGDCHVIGSDVTRLVGYFRGQGELQACPDHLPLWETPQGVPQEAPPVWPGCE